MVIEHKGKTFVRKREARDIWENLYEFFLLETGEENSFGKIKSSSLFKKLIQGKGFEIRQVSSQYSQHLSHQTIEGAFIHVRTQKAPILKGFECIPVAKLPKLAFPRFITRYLAESGYKAFER